MMEVRERNTGEISMTEKERFIEKVGNEECMGTAKHIELSGDTEVENMDIEEMLCVKPTDQDTCLCGHSKIVPRDAASQKRLQNRINRIVGQLNGIGNMIGENRYCGDILIQIGAVESALQSLGYIILQEHMQSCVVEEIKNGNEAIMEETIELIKKLK